MKRLLLPAIFILVAATSCTEPTEDNSTSATDVDTPQAAAPSTTVETKSEKRHLMESLIGEYTLHFVEDFTGANTMLEINRIDDEWTASGSSNSGGVREGYDLELTEDDLRKLNTAKIIVHPDLSVSFEEDGTIYFQTAFREEGMDFNLSKPVAEFYNIIPDSLKPESTIQNGQLWLYAADQVPQADIGSADILEVGADAYLLSYHMDSQTFDLSLFYGDCCDASIYTFK